jgi:hypothetical protein
VWFDKVMVFPSVATAPMAHAEMPENVRADYDEARGIAHRSPRGAAALLRLAIQKLCTDLGQPGENINDDIAALVKEGLSSKLQKALDSVRVIGNEAVHPGVLDVRDDPDLVQRLFELVNLIVDLMIAQPKRIDEVYLKLPAAKREAIEKRDGR